MTETSLHVRGYPDFVNENSTDAEYLSSGRWLVYGPSNRVGDFDSPNLYVASTGKQEDNLYLPSAPTESLWDASLRLGRRWLEGIVNSVGAEGEVEDPSSVMVPWMPLVGAAFSTTTGDPATHTMVADDIHRQLGMFRAKRIERLLTWTGAGTLANFLAHQRVLNQVYTPSLTDFTVIDGSYYSYDSTYPEALWYTLRLDHDPVVEDYLLVHSEDLGTKHAITIECEYEGLDVSDDLGNGIRITLENHVTSTDVRGEIWLWNYNYVGGGAFQKVEIADYPLDDQYGFYVPATPSDGVQFMRRSFDVAYANCHVSEAGEMRIQFRLFKNDDPEADDTFKVYWDLAQVARIDGYDPPFEVICLNGEIEENLGSQGNVLGQRSGADADFSGHIDEADVSLFGERYLGEHPAADYDRDGDIDSQDATYFLEDYVESTSESEE